MPQNQQPVKVEFRVLPSERDRFDEAAQRAKLDRSEWMRRRLLAAARRESEFPEEIDHYGDGVGDVDLRRVGVTHRS